MQTKQWLWPGGTCGGGTCDTSDLTMYTAQSESRWPFNTACPIVVKLIIKQNIVITSLNLFLSLVLVTTILARKLLSTQYQVMHFYIALLTPLFVLGVPILPGRYVTILLSHTRCSWYVSSLSKVRVFALWCIKSCYSSQGQLGFS
jgi:hypothetical protein